MSPVGNEAVKWFSLYLCQEARERGFRPNQHGKTMHHWGWEKWNILDLHGQLKDKEMKNIPVLLWGFHFGWRKCYWFSNAFGVIWCRSIAARNWVNLLIKMTILQLLCKAKLHSVELIRQLTLKEVLSTKYYINFYISKIYFLSSLWAFLITDCHPSAVCLSFINCFEIHIFLRSLSPISAKVYS